ncbi:F-box/WD repeat-containing protein 7 [Episyrphus balteatus]|uniref:F-box/WD repeat-containing protein 7 n=1 Tax=Episyrphus balteatus TaxID=286459 RepID=UPI002485A97C|nr:F-box/WD repeat-containing protein 7 [Episyrphus balteatus]XP_055841798.1 F-box/WD repeat-containing protein 7 [Episyrphus balteatus]
MEKTCVQSADIESTGCHSRIIINSLTAASSEPAICSSTSTTTEEDKSSSSTIIEALSNLRSPQMSSKELQLQLQTQTLNTLNDKKIYKSYDNLNEDGNDGEGRGCSVISMSTPAAESMTLYKDDDSRSGSSDDITTPIVDLQSRSNNDDDNDKTNVAPTTTLSTTNVIQVIQDHNRRRGGGCHEETTMTSNNGGVGVGIYLETPVIDEQIVGVNSHDYEKAKPKRLSDEFLMSSEDCCDDERNNSTSSTSSSHSNPLATHSNSSISKTADCSISSNSSNISGISKKEGILNDLLKSVMTADNIVSADVANLKVKNTSAGGGGGSSAANVHDCCNKSHFDYCHGGGGDGMPGASGSMSSRFRKINIAYLPFLSKVCRNNKLGGEEDDNDDTEADVADNDVQSMDAIERRDFEDEQRLTGGIILKSSSLAKNDRLKLDIVQQQQQQNAQNAANNQQRVVSSDSKYTYKDHSTTPTSSRHYKSRLTKSTAKINLTTSLNHPETNTVTTNGDIATNDDQQTIENKEDQPDSSSCNNSSTTTTTNDNCHHKVQEENDPESSNPASSAGTDSSSSPLNLRTTLQDSNPANNNKKLVEILSNPNSNESLSEHSYNTSSSHSLSRVSSSKQLTTQQPQVCLSSEEEILKKAIETINTLQQKLVGEGINDDDIATTSSSARCQYSALKYLRNSLRKDNSSNLHCDDVATGSSESVSGSSTTAAVAEEKVVPAASPLFAINSNNSHANFQQEEPNQQLNHVERRVTEFPYLDHALPLDNEFDEETWADCDEGSDDEVCTCHKDSFSNQRDKRGDTSDLLSEDALSKDVELSSYIQMVSISEDTLSHEQSMSPEFTGLQRKRKFNESRLLDGDHFLSDSGRKRIAYDYSSTPRSSQTLLLIPSPSTPLGRRTPRSLIPTRDNPPPELQDWLVQFQRWSHAERLLAVDRLIEHCEPTQVRHMMKVIEPQFQRDFISLLPRELALQVLAYLDPTDLLRAAQTCRSWRFLCDDNLLWKEKCRKAQILIEPKTDRPKRGRAGNMPPIASPWKAAYMRQHIIEMNWRSRPIREPKVLKGHDDHVITCLQFSGNRIVSGSDDNTLKVWSAVTGRCLRTLVGHTGGVWSSQMSGNIIISGSTDRTLKVWDMETGECVHTLLGHTSTVRCMHLHGKKVVSGSRDATLRVWDIERGNCLHVLVGHLAAVRCVQYDGKLIVSGAYDYMVKIWHPERQECLHTLQGHTNRVYSLQFDGIHVVSGSLDTSIRVWDVETGNCKHTLMGHQSLTSGMELRQNILVSGNADSTVKVWDITNGQCLQTLSGPNKHQSAVTCLQFNSRFVITSSDDGTVKLWDVKTGEFIRNLVALDSGGSGGVVWRIRANDTKLICAVGSRNGTEETKLMVLDFDVEGACVKCS